MNVDGCNYTFACPYPIILVMFDLSLCASVSLNGDRMAWEKRDVVREAQDCDILETANAADKLMKTTHSLGTESSGSLV